jgi:hypothetical protein
MEDEMDYRHEYRSVEREAIWTLPRVLLGGFVFLVVVYAIGFLTTGGDLAIYRFWAPKQENAKRVVFENTQSYVQGKAEYIGRLRYQYQSADAGAGKEALRTLILSEASTVDNAKLPADEQAFINSLKGAL